MYFYSYLAYIALHMESEYLCTGASDRLFRTTAVLFDEKASDQKYKNRIVYVVAHELAHQWFGNLVTMDWWSGT